MGSPTPIADTLIPPGSGPMIPNYSGTQYGGSLVSGGGGLPLANPMDPVYTLLNQPGAITGATSGDQYYGGYNPSLSPIYDPNMNILPAGGGATDIPGPTLGAGPTLSEVINSQMPSVGVSNPLIPPMDVAPAPLPNKYDLTLNRTIDVAPGPSLNVAPGPEPVQTILPPEQQTIGVATDPSNQLQVTSSESPTTPYASSLVRQPWITEGQQLAEDFNTEGLRTGQFANVVSAQGTADTSASKRRALALQRANDVARMAGYEPGTAQYQAVFDRALGEANSANLADSNAVRGLNRQAINDALDRAGSFESEQYRYATGDRAHTEDRADVMYNRDHVNRLEAKGDVERFLSTIENPIARQYAENYWANSGGDVAKFRAGIATIFKPDGSLTDEYQQMSATIPWRDIRNKYTQMTVGALNPDTGKAWTDKAEKDAYIDSHTQDAYNAMIQTQYAPATDEVNDVRAVNELTKIFTKGELTDTEYKTALMGATNTQWSTMATNNPEQYKIALDWAKANGVVSPTTVQNVNTMAGLRDWIGNIDSVVATEKDWEKIPPGPGVEGGGIKLSYPAGEGPLITIGTTLYRLIDARIFTYDDGTPLSFVGIGTDYWDRTMVQVEDVMTGDTKYVVDNTLDISG
jgi:hypothetical protein